MLLSQCIPVKSVHLVQRHFLREVFLDCTPNCTIYFKRISFRRRLLKLISALISLSGLVTGCLEPPHFLCCDVPEGRGQIHSLSGNMVRIIGPESQMPNRESKRNHADSCSSFVPIIL